MTSLLVSLMTALNDRHAAGDEEDERVEASISALVPVTEAAKRSVGQKPEIRIATFPFKVGRESRAANPAVAPPAVENRLGIVPPSNDLYLIEPAWSDLLHISRKHFAIERDGDRFFLVDRGSVCGTVVGGQHIGGHRTGGRCEIRHGDLIIVGTSSSEYIFRFEIA